MKHVETIASLVRDDLRDEVVVSPLDEEATTTDVGKPSGGGDDSLFGVLLVKLILFGLLPAVRSPPLSRLSSAR